MEGLLAPFAEEVKFPLLSANIRPDATLAPTFGASCLPYKVFTLGGEKVGVVGYTSRETPALSRPGGCDGGDLRWSFSLSRSEEEVVCPGRCKCVCKWKDLTFNN